MNGPRLPFPTALIWFEVENTVKETISGRNLADNRHITDTECHCQVWGQKLRSTFLELVMLWVQMSITKTISNILVSMTRTLNIIIYLFSKIKTVAFVLS